VLLMILGCVHLFFPRNIPPCSEMVRGEPAPGYPLSSVDRIENGKATVIIVVDSAEGEEEIELACREK
jgi:hypothetical protein